MLLYCVNNFGINRINYIKYCLVVILLEYQLMCISVLFTLCNVFFFLFRQRFSSQYMIGNQLAYSITEKYVNDCLAPIERTIGSRRNQTQLI